MGSESIKEFWFYKSQNKEIDLSSFTLPTIYTMVNITSFTYSKELKINTQNVVTRCHILVRGICQKEVSCMLFRSTSL